MLPRSPLLFLALAVLLPAGAVAAEGGTARPPNLIVVMTDDQRWDELAVMPVVSERIVGEGVLFAESFVTTPLCCPSRASFLSGRYAHNHGVKSLGGAPIFDARSTIAVWLQKSGYATAIVGKYMNDAARLRAVPPGWSRYQVFADRLRSFRGDSLYYDYDLDVDGERQHHGRAEADYSTDVLRDRALAFVEANADRPFFLLFTPFAPHAPARPAGRHAGRLATLELPEPPSLYEADTSDKPVYVRDFQRALAPASADGLAEARVAIQQERRRLLESLLAVDEAVAAILAALEAHGILDQTAIFFTSDNGHLYGEHWLVGKTYAYEESIRVPLVVRYPPLVSGPRRDGHLVLNLDLAPTLAELGSVTPPDALDGRSLVPLLRGEAPADWREDFLVETFERHPYFDIAPQEAVRSARWKYVRNAYAEPFEELYDVVADPYELENLVVTRAGDPALAPVLDALRGRLVLLRGR